jgi:hypothetical protein
MDRVLFGDETIIDFKTCLLFLAFKFEFYFLQRYCTKVALLYVIGETLLQMYQRLLATLWQIYYRGSEDIGNHLAKLI